MKYIRICPIVLLCCVFFLSACGTNTPVIRGASWGMTKEQVKQTEEAEPMTENDSRLVFEITDFEGFAGVKTYISYNFDEEKLTGCAVYFENGVVTREQSNAYLEKLTQQFGQPEKQTHSNSNTYEWETDNSIIMFMPEYYVSFKQK